MKGRAPVAQEDGKDPGSKGPDGAGLDEGAVASAVTKLVGLAVVIGLVVAGGVFLVTSALGVGDEGSAVADLPDGGQSRSPLPTVALTPSGAASPTTSPDGGGSPSESPSQKPSGKLTLSAGQSQVGPGEQIDLTGQYAGKDGTVLQVQRRVDGSWQPFADVSVRVNGDSFSTYVITSQAGEQRFRVVDPTDDTASNPVVVTVGG